MKDGWGFVLSCQAEISLPHQNHGVSCCAPRIFKKLSMSKGCNGHDLRLFGALAWIGMGIEICIEVPNWLMLKG
jgi:hypothetical protein